MLKAAGTLLALMLSLCAHGADHPDWELIDSRDGVRAWIKKIPGSGIYSLRGETTIRASIPRIIRVLTEDRYKKEWISRYSHSKMLQEHNSLHFIKYTAFHMPPLVADRDFVLESLIRVHPDKGSVTIVNRSVDHGGAPQTVGVRARMNHSLYRFDDLGDGRTRVAVEIHTDPGGWIPDWVVNILQKSWPFDTLSGLTRQAARYPEQIHKGVALELGSSLARPPTLRTGG